MKRTADLRRWAQMFLLVTFALFSKTIAEEPAVTILQSPKAPDLEKFAAEELTRILVTLFDADVSVKAEPAGDEKIVILLGSKETHPAIGEVAGDAWPNDLGGQGHLLKSLKREGRNVLLVGGGSPVATLWAVYELGHHFGMRYTLHGDFAPIEEPEFTLAGFDKVFEPNITVRAWRTFEPGLAGQESWSLEDHRRLLGQLAKLKFNRIVYVDHPEDWKPTEGIRVTGDTAGRSVFEGAKIFQNPDFAEAETDEARMAAAKALTDGIRESATKLGFDYVTVSPDKEAPGLDSISLAQPNGGVLPQFFTNRLPEALDSIRKNKQEGFAVQCWIPGNLNPDVHYLSRASFDTKITPRQALDDLVTPMCGEGVSDRLATGFAAIEEVSALIETEDPDFAVPDPKLFMEHFESVEEAPEWWAKASELYGTAVNEMYRGNTRARGGARPFILYHAKTFTFALHYMSSVQAARDAARAKDADDTEAYVEHLESAVEAMHNALQIYADVARDNSDRGVIAVLNEYAYRPLLKALDEAPLP